ncbi:MAG: hypothetical protein HOO87_01370 [Methyloglobulus sp.]|nr:hypothetical protein [Methyloglobulus sp.]
MHKIKTSITEIRDAIDKAWCWVIIGSSNASKKSYEGELILKPAAETENLNSSKHRILSSNNTAST